MIIAFIDVASEDPSFDEGTFSGFEMDTHIPRIGERVMTDEMDGRVVDVWWVYEDDVAVDVFVLLDCQ